MLLKQEFYLGGNEKPFFTAQLKEKITDFLVAENKVQRQGIKLHFEWFNYRPYLTVEGQSTPEGCEYPWLIYEHCEISNHNFCRKLYPKTKLPKWNQDHLFKLRFLLSKSPFILINLENFRIIYRLKTLQN